ncbi:MAG: NAD(P)H-binding protein [Nitriliruptoraceae bacterium]
MQPIAVIGATGFTGRLIVRALIERGHRPVAIIRDQARLSTVYPADVVDRMDVRIADVTDTGTLRRAVADARVVIATAGPFDHVGRGVVDTVLDCGIHYVDITGEQSFIRWLVESRHDQFVASGITAIPAMGFDFVPGNLATAVAAAEVHDATTAHVSYAVGRASDGAPRSSRGTRATLASMIGRTGLARVNGRLVDEWPGEVRRLAWFPPPLGPRQVAGIPGGEAITLPLAYPSLATVRTYVAVKGWQAEAMQAIASLGRYETVGRFVRRRVTSSTAEPDQAARTTTRWSVIAEVAHDDAGSTVPAQLARAWVAGTDMYGFTAQSAVAAAERLAATSGQAQPVPPGVIGPAQLGQAPVLLDDLSDRAGIRWGIVRVSDEGG